METNKIPEADGEISAGRAGGAKLVLCVILLCGAFGEFLVRGVLPAPENSADFAVFYTDARAWAQGTNPYDVDNLKRIAREAGGVREGSLQNSAYPPATFVIVAPIAMLPWSAAKIALAALNTTAVLVMVYSLVQLAGLKFTEPAGILLAAGALALAPVHTGLRIGQLTPMLGGCLVLAYLLEDRHRIWLGGLLLAIATALKPQIGAVFIAFEYVRGRFGVVLSATLLTALVFVVAIGWLGLNEVNWWQSWQHNYRNFMHGGAGDPGMSNPGRFQLLNLHYPLSAFITGETVVNIIALSFVGAVGIAAFAALLRVRTLNGELLGMSVFGVLSLLAVYNRYYSAILLVFPLAWATVQLRRGLRTLPAIVLALVAVFLAPSATILNVLAEKGALPEAVAGSWWWQRLVMPHQVYALAAMSICLVIASWQERQCCRLAAAAGA